MRGGKEIIDLDAVIVSVLSEKAFRARLANGYEFVAFLPAHHGDLKRDLAVGDRIAVRMSPFDMSKGEISGRAGEH